MGAVTGLNHSSALVHSPTLLPRNGMLVRSHTFVVQGQGQLGSFKSTSTTPMVAMLMWYLVSVLLSPWLGSHMTLQPEVWPTGLELIFVVLRIQKGRFMVKPLPPLLSSP